MQLMYSQAPSIPNAREVYKNNVGKNKSFQFSFLRSLVEVSANENTYCGRLHLQKPV